MVFTKKRPGKVVDFLANMVALESCATQNQMDNLLQELDSYSLKLFSQFLRQRTKFSNGIPSSQGAQN